MSKTAVSTLQEYMAKGNLGMPVYILSAEQSPSHLPIFVCKVTCMGLIARGIAGCKKEAKHNAAREMLKLLPTCNDNVRLIAADRSLSPCNKILVDSFYSPSSANTSYDNVFVNSVGKLNEYCTINQYKTPEYTLTETTGPDHMKMFTIRCSIGKNFAADGKANSKKQAKHEAAQEMYQLLMRTTTSKNTLDLHKNPELKKMIDEVDKNMNFAEPLDLKIEKPGFPVAESSARAMELFPKLRYRDSVKITKNIDVKDYQDHLKNHVNDDTRAIVRKHLSNANAVTKEMVLKTVLELMNLEFKCETLAQEYGECVVSYTIDSTPVITDVGIGNTLFDAKAQAVENSLNSIDRLLR